MEKGVNPSHHTSSIEFNCTESEDERGQIWSVKSNFPKLYQPARVFHKCKFYWYRFTVSEDPVKKDLTSSETSFDINMVNVTLVSWIQKRFDSGEYFVVVQLKTRNKEREARECVKLWSFGIKSTTDKWHNGEGGWSGNSLFQKKAVHDDIVKAKFTKIHGKT